MHTQRRMLTSTMRRYIPDTFKGVVADITFVGETL